MTICDLCKKDPIATAPNEALKAAPWGLVMTPPPGSGLPERRFCLGGTIVLFDALVALVKRPPAELKPD